MTELKFPPRPNLRPYKLSKEFMRYPGRNSPDIGKWLAEAYTEPGDWIMDLMCGVGQMWLSAPTNRNYDLSDQNLEAARGIDAAVRNAETMRSRVPPALVAFSPQYPQAHSSGKNERQVQMRERKSDHAIQGFTGPGADMPKVYANIASWGHPRLAVVVRNRILEGEETFWSIQNANMIHVAGWTKIDTFWRHVYPTRWQQAKLKRDPKTPVIDREYILVATR